MESKSRSRTPPETVLVKSWVGTRRICNPYTIYYVSATSTGPGNHRFRLVSASQKWTKIGFGTDVGKKSLPSVAEDIQMAPLGSSRRPKGAPWGPKGLQKTSQNHKKMKSWAGVPPRRPPKVPKHPPKSQNYITNRCKTAAALRGQLCESDAIQRTGSGACMQANVSKNAHTAPAFLAKFRDSGVLQRTGSNATLL